jgi:hypothetical protein
MTAPRYYPSLSTIFEAESLPDQLSFIKGSVQTLLDSITYKDYNKVISKNGAQGFYELVHSSVQISIPLHCIKIYSE